MEPPELSGPTSFLWGGKLRLSSEESVNSAGVNAKAGGPKKNSGNGRAKSGSTPLVMGTSQNRSGKANAPPMQSVVPAPVHSLESALEPAPVAKLLEKDVPPPEPKNGRGRLSLKSALADAGVEASKSAYVMKVLHPFLQEMVKEAVACRPEDPAGFFLQWLFQRLMDRIPAGVSQPFLEWVRAGKPAIMVAATRPDAATQTVAANFEADAPKVDSNRSSEIVAKATPESQEASVTRTSHGGSKPFLSVEAASKAAEPVEKIGRSGGRARLSTVERVLLTANQEADGDAAARAPRPPGSSPIPGGPRKSALKRSNHDPSNTELGLSASPFNIGLIETEARQVVALPQDTPICSRRTSLEDDNSSDEEDAAKHPADSLESMREMAKRSDRRRPSHYTKMEFLKPDKGKTMEAIRNVPLFENLEEHELDQLADSFQIKCFEQDAEVVSWGQRGGELHVISSGRAAVTIPSTISTLHEGEFFGEDSVLKQHLASERRIVAAHGPLITLSLQVGDLDRLNLRRKLEQKRRQNNKAGNSRRILPASPGSKANMTFRSDSRRSSAIRELAERTPEDYRLIMEAVRENTQLMDVLQLSEEQIQHIAACVISRTIPIEHYLIREGECCECLYVVRDGLFEMLNGDKLLQKLRNGQSFGELGLLYGVPSKFSVRAARHSKVFQLTGDIFKNMIKAKPSSKFDKYRAVLENADFFSERDQELLADALEEVVFARNENVVSIGTEVQRLYFVYEGALQIGEGTSARNVGEGDFFGHEGFAHRAKQQERVFVTTETATLLSMDFHTIEIVLNVKVKDLVKNLNDDFCSPEEASPALPKTLGDGIPITQDRQTGDRDKTHVEIPQRQTLQRLGVLGSGSFGLVTLEEDPRTGKWYALKAISKGYLVEQGITDVAKQEKNIQMVLHSLFIVRLWATYKDDQFLYFLMEPALGGELFEMYHDHEEWFASTEHARFYSAGVSLALDHMHSKKIIYRDLKMENVILNSKGYPMITDMGLAKVVLNKTYTVCGTADYMAPETLRRTGHNRAVDWWALGILIFIFMSGRSPFDASDAPQIYRNVVKGLKKEHFPQTFSAPLKELISALCRKLPEERLPMGPKGIVHLKQADWFQNFAWELVETQELVAPWTPPAKTAEEFSNKQIEAPTVVNYEDNGTDWDADF